LAGKLPFPSGVTGGGVGKKKRKMACTAGGGQKNSEGTN